MQLPVHVINSGGLPSTWRLSAQQNEACVNHRHPTLFASCIPRACCGPATCFVASCLPSPTLCVWSGLSDTGKSFLLSGMLIVDIGTWCHCYFLVCVKYIVFSQPAFVGRSWSCIRLRWKPHDLRFDRQGTILLYTKPNLGVQLINTVGQHTRRYTILLFSFCSIPGPTHYSTYIHGCSEIQYSAQPKQCSVFQVHQRTRTWH